MTNSSNYVAHFGIIAGTKVFTTMGDNPGISCFLAGIFTAYSQADFCCIAVRNAAIRLRRQFLSSQLFVVFNFGQIAFEKGARSFEVRLACLARPVGGLPSWRLTMSHYFFQAQYRGSTLTDDIGEEFPTLQEAEAHAAVVAKELGRNSSEAIVSVLGEDGKLLACNAGLSQ
jgi:uncharacterized protein DUF6894